MIEVPAPSLVVLIGAAGAGKSTLAARLFDPAEILSSDDLRSTVAGDPANQRANRTVFGILHREVGRRLAAGQLVVVDATNVDRGARLALVRLARAAGAPAIAIALDLAADEVHRRNAGRPGRIVPPEVVDRHLERLAAIKPVGLTPTLLAEGFSAAHVARTAAELAAIGPVRRVGPELSPP